MKTIEKFRERTIQQETAKKVYGGERTTVNRAKAADKTYNKITQYISS